MPRKTRTNTWVPPLPSLTPATSTSSYIPCFIFSTALPSDSTAYIICEMRRQPCHARSKGCSARLILVNGKVSNTNPPLHCHDERSTEIVIHKVRKRMVEKARTSARSTLRKRSIIIYTRMKVYQVIRFKYVDITLFYCFVALKKPCRHNISYTDDITWWNRGYRTLCRQCTICRHPKS